MPATRIRIRLKSFDYRLLDKAAGEIAETVVGLRDRVNGLEAAHRWVPVNQRLPPLGEDVLVWSPGWTAATQGYRTTRDVFVSMDEVDMPVTHWRPLPAGPEVAP